MVPKLKRGGAPASELTDRFDTVGRACRRSYPQRSRDTEPRERNSKGAFLLTRIRMLIAAAATTAVAVLGATPAADAARRDEMVRAINSVRGAGHHHTLRFSKSLSAGAAAWARNLMRRDVVAHSAPANRRGQGEIIEGHTGSRADIEKGVMEWLR